VTGAFVEMPPGGLTLDPARLEQTRAETELVGALLEQVFIDDAPPATHPSLPPTASYSGVPAALDGLDPRYSGLVQLIRDRDRIERSEFVELAHNQDVLPDGAIEAINDWAYQKFDKPLIDDDESIVIDRTLLRTTEVVA